LIITETFTYPGPGGPFQGTISWREDHSPRRPGVMVAHAFGGQSQFETEKAQALAELGYLGFAIDIYGQGKRATSPAQANTLMSEMNDNRPLLLARMEAAYQALRSLPQVEEHAVAAIGFCFGGKCVLDLARGDAPLRGVVSFHGVYDPPPENTLSRISSAILVLHGWDDPLATPEQLGGLANELTAAGADWQICAYGHTGHSFTNPKVQARDAGFYYSASASNRSWNAMITFLGEIFRQA
jgi:dienelactone hydrolase